MVLSRSVSPDESCTSTPQPLPMSSACSMVISSESVMNAPCSQPVTVRPVMVMSLESRTSAGALNRLAAHERSAPVTVAPST